MARRPTYARIAEHSLWTFSFPCTDYPRRSPQTLRNVTRKSKKTKQEHEVMAFQTKTDHIVWSHDYTINEFLSAYGKKMPQIVKVTQGFHGDYLVDSISTHEILRVHTHSRQKRLMGQDMYGQPLSLPINFDKMLELVVKAGQNTFVSPPSTLKSLLDKTELPFKVRLPNVTLVTPEDQDFSVFRLDSQFEQSYLLVNCILVDKLETRVRMIPSSLGDVRLAVGKGFDDRSLNWKAFLLELDEVASSLDYQGISGSSDIALYATGTPSGDNVPYENLIPKKYISVPAESKPNKPLTSQGSREKDKSVVKDVLNAIKNKVPRRKSSVDNQGSSDGRNAKTTDHYETMSFPNDKKASSLSSRSSRENGSAVMDGAVSHRAGVGNSPHPCPGNSNSSEPPTPLNRTVHDRPLKSRLEKALPKEPYVYSVKRKPEKADISSPPGKPPNVSKKPVFPTKSFPETTASSQTISKISVQRRLDHSDNTVPVIAKPNYTNNNDSELDIPVDQIDQGPPVLPMSRNRVPSGSAPQARKQSPLVAPKPKATVRPVESNNSEVLASSACPIVSWHQVPKDLSSLSCDQIAECLQLLRLDQSTINIFRDKQLNGTLLKLLSEEDLREFLKSDTGLSLIDREKTINFIKHKWRPI